MKTKEERLEELVEYIKSNLKKIEGEFSNAMSMREAENAIGMSFGDYLRLKNWTHPGDLHTLEISEVFVENFKKGEFTIEEITGERIESYFSPILKKPQI